MRGDVCAADAEQADGEDGAGCRATAAVPTRGEGGRGTGGAGCPKSVAIAREAAGGKDGASLCDGMVNKTQAQAR